MKSLAPRFKVHLRRIIDRIAMPYVEETATRISRVLEDAALVQHASMPDDYFHNLLHELRAIELATVPSSGERALSVGASGNWYFDWIEQNVGSFDEHIGIEAFEEKPTELPSYVTWIKSTADNMFGVADQSVDLVLAGQTVEHLWQDELIGFLLEAYRVLRPGGILVADSPNRIMTEPMLYSHGGHTIEYSAEEFSRALDMAGFDVFSYTGIWCSRVNGEVLDLEAGIDSPAIMARRIAEGPRRPEDAFIWWIMARRSDRSPDPEKLAQLVNGLFERHWPWRVNRGLCPLGTTSIKLNVSSTEARSLPFPLRPGRWRLSASLLRGSWDDLADAAIDIVSPGDLIQFNNPVSKAAIDGKTAFWEFKCHEHMLALSIRLRAPGNLEVELASPLDLQIIPTSTAR